MNDDNKTIYKCQECRGTMVLRTNSSSDEYFLGCENYPDCSYTEPYEVEDELNGVPDAASVWE